MSLSTTNGNRGVSTPRSSFYNSIFDDPFFPFTSPITFRNSVFGPLLDRATTESSSLTFSPNFDVKETDTAFLLEGELPGVEKKDVDIEFVDDNTLRVKGHVERSREFTDDGSKSDDKDGKTKKSSGYWASERLTGDFSRSFKFPGNIDTNGVTAALKNGLLKINVPKSNAAPASKKITVEGE